MGGLTGKTIAIDVTPILPGGENGGAKHFVLELSRGLAEAVPGADFILLTHEVSHEELATLERPNMRRVLAIGAPASGDDPKPAAPRKARRLRSWYETCYPRLPGIARRGVARLAYEGNAWVKRRRARGMPGQVGADVLFCPFTAPTFHEPGIPTVCTVYDLQFAAYPQFFDDADFAYRRSVLLDAASKATRLAAISNFSREATIAYTGIEPGRIETAYLRMSGRIIRPNGGEAELLARFGLLPQGFLIYPANFWRHKQHEMLLTAFGMACRNGLPPQVKLVLTGAPGARRDFIERAARAMGLGERVVFPGYISDDELAMLLGQARGLVFPSLYEGFGLPVLEAMAADVPVACSGSTALAEVASDAALLFDPRRPDDIAKAILSLASDHGLRQDLLARGRSRALEFSNTDGMIADYRRILAQAINSDGACDARGPVKARTPG